MIFFFNCFFSKLSYYCLPLWSHLHSPGQNRKRLIWKNKNSNGSLSFANGIWIENMKLTSAKETFQRFKFCLTEAKWSSEMIGGRGGLEHMFDAHKREGCWCHEGTTSILSPDHTHDRFRMDIPKCVCLCVCEKWEKWVHYTTTNHHQICVCLQSLPSALQMGKYSAK